MTRRWHFLLFAAVVVYLSLFYNLGRMAFIGADEPRYARVAEEMNQSGDFITPTLNHRPWLEKPPLLYWLEAASFRIFGVSEGTARFPVALCACATLLLAGWFALRNAGQTAAFATVLILATSPLFFVYGRAASTDMPLVAGLTGALVCGYQSGRRRSLGWAVASGACLGAAALAKGPIAVLLFTGIFVTYWLAMRAAPLQQAKRSEMGMSRSESAKRLAGGAARMAAGLAAFAIVAVPWYWEVWVRNGYNFVATFWLNHHLARFLTSIHHHAQPPWYYLPVLLVGFFPWVFFLGTAVLRLWQNRSELAEYRAEIFLWIWVLGPLLFFSASQSKLGGYILPAFPALAALVGLELERQQAPDLRTYRVGKVQVSLMVAFGIVLALTILFGFHFVYGSLGVGVLLALPLALGMLGAHYYLVRMQPAPLFFVIVGAMTMFAGLAFWRAAPIVDDYHSARDLSWVALPEISDARPLLQYRYFHHTALYYTRYRALPEPVNSQDALRAYMESHPQESYLVLTKKPGWLELSQRFSAKLVAHRGNLYLVEITTQGAGSGQGVRPEVRSPGFSRSNSYHDARVGGASAPSRRGSCSTG